MKAPAPRQTVLASAAVVIVAAAACSAVSLYQLASRAIPEPLSAALPIALDVGAAVGALAWITEPAQATARRWGMGLSIACMVASLAGNGVEHALAKNYLSLNLYIVLAIGAVIPATMWGCVHLAALMMHQPGTRKNKRTDRSPGQRTDLDTPAPGRSASPVPDAVAARRGRRGDRANWLTEWLADNPGATAGQEVQALQSEFHISDTTARRVRRAMGRTG